MLDAVALLLQYLRNRKAHPFSLLNTIITSSTVRNNCPHNNHLLRFGLTLIKTPFPRHTRPPSSVTRHNPCKTLFQCIHTGRVYAEHQSFNICNKGYFIELFGLPRVRCQVYYRYARKTQNTSWKDLRHLKCLLKMWLKGHSSQITEMCVLRTMVEVISVHSRNCTYQNQEVLSNKCGVLYSREPELREIAAIFNVNFQKMMAGSGYFWLSQN